MAKGLVIKSTGSWYTVLEGDRTIPCKIKGKFRLEDIKCTNPVTVGDIVHFNMEDDKLGVIYEIEPRKNYILRKATRFHKEAHMIAANIDQAVLMVSLKKPKTPFEFIDRYLLMAESFFIDTKIILNKCDLVSDEEVSYFKSIYEGAGYDCFDISVKQELNLDKVKPLFTNKISLISGNSGVGKSTFINYLNPNLNLSTNSVSEYHKSGKHTTTFSEIFKLNNDSYIIDTPGIKSFGLLDIKPEEAGLYFKEIFHASKECKFNNCMHLEEPGCAVKAAVEAGKIHEMRYRSYINIVLDDNEKYR